MRAGPLTQRVTVQAIPTTADAFNQPVPGTPTTVGTYWAEVRPLRGEEAARVKQVQAEATHFVRLRYGVPVTTQHQLLYRGRTLSVVQVLEVNEAHEELNLLCAEVLTGG